MDLVVAQRDQVAVVVFSEVDSLDASNSREAKEQLKEIVATYEQVVVDGSALNFVDSSGLGAFLSALRQASTLDREIKLAALKQPVRVVLELTRMHRIFEIYQTVEAAIASYEQ